MDYKEMKQPYDDLPYEGNDFIDQLEGNEFKTFIKGYIHGCIHIKELLRTIRTKFLNAALENETEILKSRLMTYVRLLDCIEDSIQARENAIHSRSKESPDFQ